MSAIATTFVRLYYVVCIGILLIGFLEMSFPMFVVFPLIPVMAFMFITMPIVNWLHKLSK